MAARTYVALDLKSYYASVECVYRGLDPLKALLLVADETRSDQTICLAVSPALKALGVPGRPRLFEAKQKIREAEARLRRHIDYIIAPPRMAAYIRQSAEIYKIILGYVAPEDVHVYSIDECFIDATGYLHAYHGSAHELAMTIIRDVLRQTGITATVGIGTNLYLAKVGMDIVAKHAPPDADGVRIAELDEQRYRELLWEHQPLTDFWMVGSGTAARLGRLGIRTMGDLAQYSLYDEEWLYKVFGVNAELLIDHAWGIETTTMRDIKAYRPVSNSLSNGQVLPRPYSFHETRVIVQEMANALCLDLSRKNLLTESVTMWVGFDPESVERGYSGPCHIDYFGRITPNHAKGTRRFRQPTNAEREISDGVLALFDDPARVNRTLLVRRIGLCANRVTNDPGTVQLDLFVDHRRQERDKKLQLALLELKSRYGKNAVLRGMNFLEGATMRER
ncbi:MAG: DNA methylase, partial [Oscillospiraceae bacterium]|nr:DNA methylase [Oscillospiraceae bacterium]